MNKLLLYGGGFNPPHLGHAHLLRAAIDAVQPDLTLVVPSALSPHKTAAAVALTIRAEMCRCFKDCGGRVKISEIERAGRHDKSYTIKTLRRLRKLYPGARLYMLVGSDMLLAFEQWRRWRRILAMTTLVAAPREPAELPALEAKKQQLECAGGTVILLDVAPMPMSSTEIRAAVAAGEPTEGLLHPQVRAVIDKHGLYRRR